MKLKKYPIHRQAEVQLAYAEACLPRFHDLLGHAIESDRLPSEDARLLVSAAQEVTREGASPCASVASALQKLRQRVYAGKLSHEQVTSVEDLIMAVDDSGGIADLDSLIQVVADAVRAIGYEQAVEDAVTGLGKVLDPAETALTFEKLAQLGKARASAGSTMTWSTQDIHDAANSTIRDALPTGMPDLDNALGGGIERASLAVVMGNPGDGKSLFLCHAASEALVMGLNVAYVTLELSEAAIKQRIYCNILNMTKEELLTNGPEAMRRKGLTDAALASRGGAMGNLRLVYMTPRVSTVAQIRQWLRDGERDGTSKTDLLVVDYADKLGAKVSGKEGSSYAEQGAVYDQLRNLIIERDGWGWTASQATGRAGRKKKLDVEDVADSMEKVRIADTLIALVRTEDDIAQSAVRFRLPKRRNGEAHLEVGPLPMDAPHGRMVTMDRQEPW